jgi:RNA 3'-terminal phosphate cyclase (ATP)
MTPSGMVEIDGAMGEGGGQVLRTALSLSVITGRPLQLYNIRAKRTPPGLKPQHLQAVRAAAAISSARVEGAQAGSRRLTFEPRGLLPGAYRFDIGTAGATSLVLQTLLLPLSFADQPSQLEIVGGSHVPWSPSYHYLAWQWLPMLERIGYRARLGLPEAGYYPRGGGRLRGTISPAAGLKPLRLATRGRLVEILGLAAVTRLDRSIACRMERQAALRLAGLGVPIRIAVEVLEGVGPGAFLALHAVFADGASWCDTALGAPGKPSERVADEAADLLLAFLETDGAVDRHLADQLMLPLSFVPGVSELRTAAVTRHLLTNAEVVRAFLPVDIEVQGPLDQPATVRVRGVSRPPVESPRA